MKKQTYFAIVLLSSLATASFCADETRTISRSSSTPASPLEHGTIYGNRVSLQNQKLNRARGLTKKAATAIDSRAFELRMKAIGLCKEILAQQQRSLTLSARRKITDEKNEAQKLLEQIARDLRIAPEDIHRAFPAGTRFSRKK